MVKPEASALTSDAAPEAGRVYPDHSEETASSQTNDQLGTQRPTRLCILYFIEFVVPE